MGYSILELVLRRLQEEGFTAGAAYPGQKFPLISGPVAAVHLEQVDRDALTVTVEVNILCPAAMGGTACEVEALRATEVLRWAGAVCVQNGCSYDGISQVYVVPIRATFTGVTEADSCAIGPGFSVYINSVLQPYAVAVSETEAPGYQVQYAMGQSAPAGISRDGYSCGIVLEERIPPGSPETAEPVGTFTLKIVTELKTELYYHCRWTSVERSFTRDGLRRVRRGVAMEREELANE